MIPIQAIWNPGTKAITPINHLPPVFCLPRLPFPGRATIENSVILGLTENVRSPLPGCVGTPTRDTSITSRAGLCDNLRHLGDDMSPSNVLAPLPHMCSYGCGSGRDERFCLPLALRGAAPGLGYLPLWAHPDPVQVLLNSLRPCAGTSQPTGRRPPRQCCNVYTRATLYSACSFILL